MKAKFGAIVVAGSGKVGGHVFSKNRGGAYMRTKVTPSNPNSAAQQGVRAILSSLSQQWGALTDAQRKSWSGAVESWSKTDVFGDIKNPSGINLFVRLNSVLLNSSQPIILVPPLKLEMPYSEIISASMAAATGIITITMSDNEYDGVLLAIAATPKLSNGVSFVKSQFRRIGVFTGAASAVATAGSYAAKFGLVTVGSNVVLQVQPVLANGQIGTPQLVKVAVV